MQKGGSKRVRARKCGVRNKKKTQDSTAADIPQGGAAEPSTKLSSVSKTRGRNEKILNGEKKKQQGHVQGGGPEGRLTECSDRRCVPMKFQRKNKARRQNFKGPIADRGGKETCRKERTSMEDKKRPRRKKHQEDKTKPAAGGA